MHRINSFWQESVHALPSVHSALGPQVVLAAELELELGTWQRPWTPPAKKRAKHSRGIMNKIRAISTTLSFGFATDTDDQLGAVPPFIGSTVDTRISVMVISV